MEARRPDCCHFEQQLLVKEVPVKAALGDIGLILRVSLFQPIN